MGVACRIGGAPRMLAEGDKHQRDKEIALRLVGLDRWVLAQARCSSHCATLGHERVRGNRQEAVASYLSMR